MNKRLELHDKLKQLIDSDNVYFQPPASVQLSYPCVIYSIGSGDAKYADGMVYNYINNYELLFIFKQPNIDIIEQVLVALPMCKMTRAYVVDNLNHYAFSVYY